MMSRSFTKREKILLLIMAVLLLGLVYYRFVIVETANAVERYDVTELESELLVEQMKAEGIHLPIVAIGGITAEDIPELMLTGVTGIALSGTILRAEDPVKEMEKVCRECLGASKTSKTS